MNVLASFFLCGFRRLAEMTRDCTLERQSKLTDSLMSQIQTIPWDRINMR